MPETPLSEETAGHDPPPAAAGNRSGADALLARFVRAGEEERGRIAGEIHDESIQAMTAAGMRLQLLRGSLADPEQEQRLDELEQTVKLALKSLRQLIVDLQPPRFGREGLAEALEAYVGNLHGEGTVAIELEDRLETEPSGATRILLYRIAQELLRDARRAGAPGITLALGGDASGYRLALRLPGGDAPDGAAFAASRERIEFAGGRFELDGASAACSLPARPDPEDAR